MAASTVNSPSAIVIGAGVAGLVCASTLADLGIQVFVMDMGRAVGGRMSQRKEKRENSQDSFFFDHGAQYFTVKNPEVQSLVDRWRALGVLSLWKGRIGAYDATSRIFTEDADPQKERWVGVPKMSSLCEAMASHPGVNVRLGVTVRRLERERERESGGASWKAVSGEGEVLGSFHAAVVAAAYRTVPVEVVPNPEFTQTLKSVEALPCYALMVVFPFPLTEVKFDGATVLGSEKISWAARDSSKPGRQQKKNFSSPSTPSPECWVVHSTPEFAHLANQDAPPGRPSPEFLTFVGEALLTAFGELVEGKLPPPLFLRAHRWGGAFPKNAIAPDSKFLVDEKNKIAVCGDFCVGPRVESAILSGLKAAEKINYLLKTDSGKL